MITLTKIFEGHLICVFIADGPSNGVNEPYDHGKDTADFYNVTKDFREAMKKDVTVVNQYEVKMVNKVFASILME